MNESREKGKTKKNENRGGFIKKIEIVGMCNMQHLLSGDGRP